MNDKVSRAACFTGLTDIIEIGDISVHIQTEYLKDKMSLITIVNRSGRCIHRFERDCAKHANKPGFLSKLAMVARAQQGSIIRRIREIWTDYLKKQSISPPPNAITQRVSFLLDLGLKIYHIGNSKESARATWLEALELDPENRLVNACLSDSDESIKMAQHIRRTNRIKQAMKTHGLQCKT
jgi:hypothetical protein